MPSAQPSVIIRREDRYHSTGGTTKPGIAFGVRAANSPAAELSILQVELLHDHAFEMRDHVARRRRREAGDSVSITQAIR
jgi:hypothetical protein